MSKLNILYSMICREYHEYVTKRIEKQFDIGNELAITELFQGRLNKSMITYEICDVYYGHYYKYKEYEKCPTVDKELLDNMSPYCLDILKMMDRKQSFDMDFESRMQLYLKHIRFWNYVLDYYKINCAVFLNIPHEVVDYTIYCLCKIKGIETCVMYVASPALDKLFISDAVDNIGHEVEQEYANLYSQYYNSHEELPTLGNELRKLYKQYVDIAKQSNFESMIQKRTWPGASKKAGIKYLTYMEIRYLLEKKYMDNGKITDGRKVSKQLVEYLDESNLKYKLLREKYNTIAKVKTMNLQKMYNKSVRKPNYKEKYVYYALHYQPEATSSPLGGMYANQLLAIETLAKNLPLGMKLYVKEHPSQLYVGRTEKYYERISNIDNVVLVPTEENTYKLIKNSVAVSSLTGTICLEALFFNKPVIMLGNYVYRYAPGVFFVQNDKDCINAFKKITSNDYKIDHKMLKLFFIAIDNCSRMGNIGYGRYIPTTNAEAIGSYIEEFIDSKKIVR